MAIPPRAYVFPQVIDPSDLVEFQMDLSGPDGLLEDKELIASYTLTLLPESVALGLTILTAAPYALTAPDNVSVRAYFEIAAASRDNAAFSGDGASLPMELTITTSSNPARRFQRTIVLKVAQQ